MNISKLKVFEVLNTETRISSVDIFRAFAIVPVVLYHYKNLLPFGFLGVDLFFVISGLLVGGILVKLFSENKKIQFLKFILQRGFKIWPSFYWFILFGTIFGLVFLGKDSSFYIFSSFKDAARYLFFYQNYTGKPFHNAFDLVWSLCVEEHFYIMLPIMFIIIKKIFENNFKILLFAICLFIITGVGMKFFSYYFMPGVSTYAATHTRIDALGWGVLLAFIINYYDVYFKKSKRLHYLFFIGVLIMALNIYIYIVEGDKFYFDTLFLSINPFAFFLMLFGLYYVDFSKFKILRFIAYFSYNWYLWHVIVLKVVLRHFENDLIALPLYLICSFCISVLFTIIVEEKFLALRSKILRRLFPAV